MSAPERISLIRRLLRMLDEGLPTFSEDPALVERMRREAGEHRLLRFRLRMLEKRGKGGFR